VTIVAVDQPISCLWQVPKRRPMSPGSVAAFRPFRVFGRGKGRECLSSCDELRDIFFSAKWSFVKTSAETIRTVRPMGHFYLFIFTLFV